MSTPCVLVSECDMIELDAFLPELQLAFQALPDEIAGHYTREAAIEFCTRTGIVQQELTIDLQCNVQDVLVESLCESLRVDIILTVDGHRRNAADLFRLSCGCGVSGARFVPPNILMLDRKPTMDRPGGLHLRVGVVPIRDACEVPRDLYERFHPAIIKGAKSMLYFLKNQDWYDPQLAQEFKRQFDAAIAAAKIDQMLNYSRGPVPIKPRHRFV